MIYAIGFACATWWAFVVWYALRAKWWRTGIGRNTQFVSLAFALVLSRIFVVSAWPAVHEVLVIGFVVYIGTGLLAIQRLVQLEKAQRDFIR